MDADRNRNVFVLERVEAEALGLSSEQTEISFNDSSVLISMACSVRNTIADEFGMNIPRVTSEDADTFQDEKLNCLAPKLPICKRYEFALTTGVLKGAIKLQRELRLNSDESL